MRKFIAILFLLISVNVTGQQLSKEYVDNWIKQCDPNAEVDSVKAFFIDGQYFDLLHNDSAFRVRLGSIKINRVSSISYSEMKMDNYVPGKGTIAVLTIEKKSMKEIMGLLEEAKNAFKDKYVSFSQHILIDAKDPVLLIDKKSIHHTLVGDALNKIDPKDIYDISVLTDFSAPATIYGQNAKNGLVQIWTNKNFNGN